MTVQGTEEIPFERTRQSKQTQDEKRQEKDLKTAMQGSNKSEIVGRRVCLCFGSARNALWRELHRLTEVFAAGRRGLKCASMHIQLSEPHKTLW